MREMEENERERERAIEPPSCWSDSYYAIEELATIGR